MAIKKSFTEEVALELGLEGGIEVHWGIEERRQLQQEAQLNKKTELRKNWLVWGMGKDPKS